MSAPQKLVVIVLVFVAATYVHALGPVYDPWLTFGAGLWIGLHFGREWESERTRKSR